MLVLEGQSPTNKKVKHDTRRPNVDFRSWVRQIGDDLVFVNIISSDMQESEKQMSEREIRTSGAA